MPDLAIVTFVLVLAAGALVVLPLRRGAAPPSGTTERDAAELRHRVAIEALRDVEADRRAGSLDDAAFAAELAAAEEHAAGTRAALDATAATAATDATGVDHDHRRRAAFVAAVIGLLVVAGAVVPPPIGFAGRPVVNEAALAAERAEEARQERIAALVAELDVDAPDVDVLSELADAYLAGDTPDDLVLAATVLGLIIGLEPDNEDAYRRIITAYVRAGDYENARAALASFVELEPGPADIAFFSGLIALRDGEPATAIDAFDRFLELAPEDERATMVRALRADAQSQVTAR